MMTEEQKQERFLHAPEMSDQAIAKAFEGTNFGRTDYREFLAYSVLKKVCGWYCGWTITTIMVEMGLITPKHHKVTKLGRMFLSDCYKDPFVPHTAPIEPICAVCGAKWVKCSERMPEETEVFGGDDFSPEVLTINQHGEQWVGRTHWGKWIHTKHKDCVIQAWIPLPAAPKP